MTNDSPFFSDKLSEDVIDSIQNEIAHDLFQQWSDSNLDEGSLYAEWKFFSYADESLKQAYNKHYGYIEGDEYYLG